MELEERLRAEPYLRLRYLCSPYLAANGSADLRPSVPRLGDAGIPEPALRLRLQKAAGSALDRQLVANLNPTGWNRTIPVRFQLQ